MKKKNEKKRQIVLVLLRFFFLYWRLSDQVTFIISPGRKEMWREL